MYGEGEVCKTNRSKMNTEMVEKLRFWWPNGMGPGASSLQDYTIKVDISHHVGIINSLAFFGLFFSLIGWSGFFGRRNQENSIHSHRPHYS